MIVGNAVSTLNRLPRFLSSIRDFDPFDSRILFDLTCCHEEYFRACGTDCRRAFPTVLNGSRRIIQRLFYCGDKPNPSLFFHTNGFFNDLDTVGGNGFPYSVTGAWEFPYVSISSGYDPGTCRSEPAKDFLLTFEPEFRKFLEKFEIDPRAFRVRITQWNLQADPDDSMEHDLVDGVLRRR